jgi:hypothetical protein
LGYQGLRPPEMLPGL